MINAFTAQWNEASTPFQWIKTADQILAKAGAQAISYQRIGTLADAPPTGTIRHGANELRDLFCRHVPPISGSLRQAEIYLALAQFGAAHEPLHEFPDGRCIVRAVV